MCDAPTSVLTLAQAISDTGSKRIIVSARLHGRDWREETMSERGMGQEPTGKASRLVERIREQGPLQPGERYPERPKLRLRADTPTVEISDITQAREILEGLAAGAGIVALRDAETRMTTAVVVPVEQYVQLAGAAIEGDDRFEATPEHTITPTPDALATSYIEQVDREVQWKRGSRVWPEQPSGA
jgi:hypothetical protein